MFKKILVANRGARASGAILMRPEAKSRGDNNV